MDSLTESMKNMKIKDKRRRRRKYIKRIIETDGVDGPRPERPGPQHHIIRSKKYCLVQSVICACGRRGQLIFPDKKTDIIHVQNDQQDNQSVTQSAVLTTPNPAYNYPTCY